MAAPSAPAEAVADTMRRFRAAGEAGDVEQFMGTLAPGAVLHSPISLLADFNTDTDLRELMEVVFDSIDDIRYFEEVGDASTRALFYRAHVGGQPVEEACLLRLDEQARVTEITLWFRPLPGLTAVLAALGPRLARRRGRARGLLVALLTRPLALLTRAGDRVAVRLVKR